MPIGSDARLIAEVRVLLRNDISRPLGIRVLNHVLVTIQIRNIADRSDSEPDRENVHEVHGCPDHGPVITLVVAAEYR